MVTVWFLEFVEIIEGYLCPSAPSLTTQILQTPHHLDILHIQLSGDYVRVFGENTAENSPSEE